MNGNKGIVYLVGAGPGDPELLTLKAQRIISEADVILYDRLVNKEILKSAREDVELVYVGKESDHHVCTQDEINDLLVKYGKEGKYVARLKGGDPYLFGRGGEEGEYLIRNGVKVGSVPGITSAISVPGHAGIPVTHRDHTSIFVAVTGHEEPGKSENIEWEKLATFKSTIVVLMGVSNLEKIAAKLVDGGKDPDTPVALIERGTTEDERVTKGTLKDIAEVAKREGVKPPAITVIGGVVGLSDVLKP
ncbi:MAG: uroporphyrinogen-III C-methyltransferase [Halobacteriota archaeon]|nr:uroporphyrinogen-III C-methyltransferase [Halobacteriota archaeon]